MSKLIIKHFFIIIVCVMFLSLSACTPAENSADEAQTIQTTVIEIEKYGHAVLDITTADFPVTDTNLVMLSLCNLVLLNWKCPFTTDIIPTQAVLCFADLLRKKI